MTNSSRKCYFPQGLLRRQPSPALGKGISLAVTMQMFVCPMGSVWVLVSNRTHYHGVVARTRDGIKGVQNPAVSPQRQDIGI
jgi:hypothetical protein